MFVHRSTPSAYVCVCQDMFEIYHNFSREMDESHHVCTFRQVHELLGLKESVGTDYLIREIDSNALHFHFGQYIGSELYIDYTVDGKLEDAVEQVHTEFNRWKDEKQKQSNK